MDGHRRAAQVQAVGRARGHVVLLAGQHGGEFTIALDQVGLLGAHGRQVGVVGAAGVHADAVGATARVDGGVFKCRPAQLQEQALLRVQHGGLACRDAEERRVEAVGVFQHSAGRHKVGSVAHIFGHRWIDLVRGKVADAFAVGQQVGPEGVQVVGVVGPHRHADDGDAVVVLRTGGHMASSWGGSALQALGHAGDGGPVIHLGHRQVQAQLLDAAHEAHHQQRSGARVEHIAIVGQVVQAQQFLPDAAQALGHRQRVGINGGAGLNRRQRQAAPVDLAAGRGGQFVKCDEAHGDHVVGQAVAQPLPPRRQQLGQRRAARAQHHVGDQLAAGAGHVGGGHGGVLDGLVGHQGQFDVAGFDAEAVHLQLLVDAALVGEHAVGGAADQVAGGVPAAGQAGGAVQKAFAAQLGLAQVAVGQGVAPQQQFAGVAAAERAGVGVAQGQQDMGQGRADGRNAGPGGGRARQLKGGDHVAFGGAIVVVQCCLGQALEQAADGGCDLQLLAGTDHFTQGQGRLAFAVRVFIGLGQHLQCHIGQENAFNALRLQCLAQQGWIAPVAVRDQHQGAAASQGGEDLLEMHVEGQGRELQGSGRLPQAGMLRMPLNQMAQGQVAHGHTFGPPGGARGEQHVSQVAAGGVGHALRGRDGVQAGHGADQVLQGRQGAGLTHHHPRLRVGQHGLQSIGRVAQVQGHIGHARFDGGQDGDHGVGGPRGGDGDSVAGDQPGLA